MLRRTVSALAKGTTLRSNYRFNAQLFRLFSYKTPSINYTGATFTKDFPTFHNNFSTRADFKKDLLDPEVVIGLHLAGFILNQQKIIQREIATREERRKLIQSGDIEGYEKFILDMHDEADQTLPEDIEEACKTYGVGLDKLQKSLESYDEKLSQQVLNEIQRMWYNSSSMVSESTKFNKKNLDTNTLMDTISYLKEVGKEQESKIKNRERGQLVLTSLVNDKLAMERKIEADDLLLDPKKTDPKVTQFLHDVHSEWAGYFPHVHHAGCNHGDGHNHSH